MEVVIVEGTGAVLGVNVGHSVADSKGGGGAAAPLLALAIFPQALFYIQLSL